MKHTLSKTIQDYKGVISEEVISVERNDQNECSINLKDHSGETSIDLTKEELSDFIGLMLHVQSLIKRKR